ncbi:MAG: CoA transferase [Actinobacteria bacterium]|nr:CoA transferase [Actinomycetota bacterium]
MSTAALLAGVRIVEVSLLGAASITTALSDLGADVIKVEPPGGDYGRDMTWPIVEGTSLLFLHLNRGKRSVVIDLRTAEGVEVFEALVRDADVVVEAMRPGALERRGLGYDRLREINPRVVFMAMSGFGDTGPYRSLPSHGIAFDTWAGIVEPEVDEEGLCSIPPHVSIGLNAAPLYGAVSILAGVIHARATGEGCRLELAQSDAAVAFDWLRTETERAHERPESEVHGNAVDGFERRAPGIAGMAGSVRYQIYATSDGYVLLMASERKFWRNFCAAIGRADLFETHSGADHADHARGDLALKRELAEEFRQRSSAEWLALGVRDDIPIAPVNTRESLRSDPQFLDRLPWLPAARFGADMVPHPVRVDGAVISAPGRAPDLGQHTDEVLGALLTPVPSPIQQSRAQGAVA